MLSRNGDFYLDKKLFTQQPFNNNQFKTGNGPIGRESDGAFPTEVQRSNEEWVDVVQLGDPQHRQEQLTVTHAPPAHEAPTFELHADNINDTRIQVNTHLYLSLYSPARIMARFCHGQRQSRIIPWYTRQVLGFGEERSCPTAHRYAKKTLWRLIRCLPRAISRFNHSMKVCVLCIIQWLLLLFSSNHVWKVNVRIGKVICVGH